MALASVWRIGHGRQGGKSEPSQEATAVIQVTGDSDHDGSTRGDENWSHSECVLKGQSTGFADKLDTSCGSKVFLARATGKMKLPSTEMTALEGVALGDIIRRSDLNMLILRCHLDIQVEMNSKQVLLPSCSKWERRKYGSKPLQYLRKALFIGVRRKASHQVFLSGEDGRKVLQRR